MMGFIYSYGLGLSSVSPLIFRLKLFRQRIYTKLFWRIVNTVGGVAGQGSHT